MRFLALETPAKLPTVATVTCVREDPVCFFLPFISHGLIDCDLNKNVLPRGDSCDSRRLPAVFRQCFLKIIRCQLRQSATRLLFHYAISRNRLAAAANIMGELCDIFRHVDRYASAYEQAPPSRSD
jgi:hypothetical protein